MEKSLQEGKIPTNLLSPERLLFFDIECMRYDTLIVFLDSSKREVAHFWSTGYDRQDAGNGFARIKDVIKGKTLIGYNNYNYDDKMLLQMINGICQKWLKSCNDQIISGKETYHIQPDFSDLDCYTLDCMQQIDLSHPSLKKIEGNLGLNIHESSVSFDINRPLTDQEKAETLDYCRSDVSATIDVFKLRKDAYFIPKLEIVKMLPAYLQKRSLNWNTTTIVSNILTDGLPKPRHDDWLFNYRQKCIDCEIPESVVDMWDKAKVAAKHMEKLPGKVTINDFGCSIDFSSGGLHGVALTYAGKVDKSMFRNVKLLDVGSMYPSIAILLNALDSHTKQYDKIRKERLAIKHKDKVRADSLKLILNSTYGLFKNQYSLLFDPLSSVSVCVYGQMALYDLCKRLNQSGYRVININTDGVAFVNGNDTDWQIIKSDWETEWGLSLDLDTFDQWIQKDVNNYIAVSGSKVKVKGGDCKKYNFEPEKGVHNLFGNNDARILHIALVDKLLYNKDPVNSMIDNLDHPELFMYILKAGNTYKCTVDSDGHEMQKVNRIFACCDKSNATKLFKLRLDGGIVNYSDVPEKMLVWNEDVRTLDTNLIDIDHYVAIVNKRLKGWLE